MFFERQLDEVVRTLLDKSAVNEVVVISTCNRTEIYAILSDVDLGKKELFSFLCAQSGVGPKVLEPLLYFYEGKKAIRHLFEVSTSLDSMVVGEAQILGQLKEAYALASELQATGIIFNRLFHRAFGVGKRVRTETPIGESAVSISYAAIELAKKVFEDLSGRTVMIVGAGKMSELTAKHLKDQGVKSVLVSNRTYDKAVEMAKAFNGQAVRFDSLIDEMATADIVVSSTAAPHPVIQKEDMAKVMKKRRNKPIFLIDIAVPRDIEPGVNSLYNVYLYDIDDLQNVVESNLAERQKAAQDAEEIIAEEIKQFTSWLSSLEVAPTIVELKQLSEQIKQEELDKALTHLAQAHDLSEEDKEHIKALSKVLINRLLHEPILRLKQLTKNKDGYTYVESIRYLFGLDGVEAAVKSKGEEKKIVKEISEQN
jgi:glutamyl-tRNA reductase